MGEKERLNTAIHESGHAITGYFNKDAMELYKATIIARGGALGVVSAMTDFINLFRLSSKRTHALEEFVRQKLPVDSALVGVF